MMTKFVVFPEVALHLAEGNAFIPVAHQLLVPTLFRSQLLARLQAESLVTFDETVQAAARDFVDLAPNEALTT